MHELLYSCQHVLMYSYTPVLLQSSTSVLIYSCTPVLMHSCTPVLLYSCTPVLLYFCIPLLRYLSNFGAVLNSKTACSLIYSDFLVKCSMCIILEIIRFQRISGNSFLNSNNKIVFVLKKLWRKIHISLVAIKNTDFYNNKILEKSLNRTFFVNMIEKMKFSKKLSNQTKNWLLENSFLEVTSRYSKKI